MEQSNANKKSLIWLLVINDKKEASIDTIETTLRGYATMLLNYSGFHYVFTIIHNKDTQKRTHLHAFIELYEKATKKAVLDILTELLDIDRLQLSLEPSNSPILGVQYLTHKNQPEKEPYTFQEIQANNIEELERRFGEEYSNPEDEKKHIIFGSKTIAELLEKLTLEEAKKVLPIWKAVKEEQGYDKAGLIDQLNKIREDYCTLYDLTNQVFDVLRYKVLKNSPNDFNLYFGRLLAIFETLLPF